MTARRESMPCLSGARAHWDAEAQRVRYFASFEGAPDDADDAENEWIEIPAEDFARLTNLYAQEAIDYICHAVTSTLEHVNSAMEEFMVFRKAMEAMMPRQSAPEDKGN
jgi:hypothetical protein